MCDLAREHVRLPRLKPTCILSRSGFTENKTRGWKKPKECLSHD